MPTPNPWLKEAEAAREAYRDHIRRGDYPSYPAEGWCGMAARSLWEAVTGRTYPYRASTALGMYRLARAAGHAIEGSRTGNAYHAALAHGAIRPGAQLFFGGNIIRGVPAGHVVTVVAVTGDAGSSLANVQCFENTSAGPPRGPGTTISRLDRICGERGSDRVLAVVNVPWKETDSGRA